MKHRIAFRKLRRPSAHRWAMLRWVLSAFASNASYIKDTQKHYFSTICSTMVSQLVMHERIETTVPKAKELRRIADQMVTLGKDVSCGQKKGDGSICSARGITQSEVHSCS